MNISLDKLRLVPSADLYRLYLSVGALLEDPRRILEVRRHLHLGVEVTYVGDDPLGPMRQGRVIELRPTQAVIKDIASGRHRLVPYVAIVPGASSEPPEASMAVLPKMGRDQFSIGDTVGFTDKYLHERFGTVVRLNQKTASIDCHDGEGHWRVSYGLLRRVVDV